MEFDSTSNTSYEVPDKGLIRKGRKNTRRRSNLDKKYRRYEKPPYSYVGLIALAIQNSTTKMLKLSDILSRISSMFPFFKGEYQGWRDSVRHNLSQNKCFKKVLPDPSRPHSKGNFWTVDISLIPTEKLKRQNTSVSRNVAPGFTYAKHLTDIFDLESGKLRAVVNRMEVCDFLDSSASINNIVKLSFEPPHDESGLSPISPSTTRLLDEHRNVVFWKSSTGSSANQHKHIRLNDHIDQASYTKYNGSSNRRCPPAESNCSDVTEYSRTSEVASFSFVKSLKETDSLVAPNMKPFQNYGAPPLSSLLYPLSKPMLISNIDLTVGPEGPPNITWASSTILPYHCFPEELCFESADHRDQSEFLLEQASILSNSNTNQNHVVCMKPNLENSWHGTT
uniref:Fork-head domain-containing protein n=1 Tax=Ciona savignyi TaxID=51511 RepID=H2ZDW9_CIOSA